MGLRNAAGIWRRVSPDAIVDQPVPPVVVLPVNTKRLKPKAPTMRLNASAGLAFSILIVAATMMHPTFASLIAIVLIAVLLTLMRWVAHLEGRSGG